MIILIIWHKKQKKISTPDSLNRQKDYFSNGEVRWEENQKGQDKKGSGWETIKPQGD